MHNRNDQSCLRSFDAIQIIMTLAIKVHVIWQKLEVSGPYGRRTLKKRVQAELSSFMTEQVCKA